MMGRFEKRPDNQRSRSDLPRAAENALWDVVEDLENLQQNVLRSLQDDLKRLEGEKTRLIKDIQRLAAEKEELEQSRQLTEQQVLIRQLAEVLAKHISSQLQSSLNSLVNQTIEGQSFQSSPLKSAQVNTNTSSDISQMFNNLDDNVTIVFNSLLQELKNYQSDLSQQLSRMYDQQQQGESILVEFVNRLRWELERSKETTALKLVTGGAPTVLQLPEQPKNSSVEKSPPRVITEPTTFTLQELPTPESADVTVALPPKTENTSEPISVLQNDFIEEPPKSPPPETSIDLVSVLRTDFSEPPPKSPPPETAIPTASIFRTEFSEQSPTEITEPPSVIIPEVPQSRQEITLRSKTSPTSPNWSQVQVGLLLIGLSTVVSSLYNIAIKTIFYRNSNLIGELGTQGLISPTLGNIFFILMLRSLVVVPIILLIAPILYPPIWQELKNLFDRPQNNRAKSAENTQVLWLSVLSGGFLFLSQVLIYIAIGELKTGIAIALFFIYPVISTFLSSFLWRENLNILSGGAIATIFCGELLILGSSSLDVSNTILGSTTGILSGIAFGIYVILTKSSATKLHPVSFSSINFVTMLILSLICLMIPLPTGWNLALNSINLLEIILSAFMLGVLTLCSYLLNNFGIRRLGAPLSAIIGAAVPVITVIFAGLIIQENLDIVPILGVLLVTFGAAAIGLEKMQTQIKSSS
ncbi:EamA family transporter [Cronbergia sp. UHCC 0137]|uniref:EamA family transporter n=1 Tax=Cronbergia sp. UHCC 0137 TaxID=3110239 RepID=UPI002B213E22|nr:EamA family transporter [Cronbergia sp. UHCC 0137]MEA5616413.1 EamA family transporter [Cronbergia sp. UHCC 0137]